MLGPGPRPKMEPGLGPAWPIGAIVGPGLWFRVSRHTIHLKYELNMKYMWFGHMAYAHDFHIYLILLSHFSRGRGLTVNYPWICMDRLHLVCFGVASKTVCSVNVFMVSQRHISAIELTESRSQPDSP